MCNTSKSESGVCKVCFPFCTQTFREPVSDYQVVREKAASQRRDVERALTRFMAKTGETQSLFKDDITAFPCEWPYQAHLVFQKSVVVCCFKHSSLPCFLRACMPPCLLCHLEHVVFTSVLIPVTVLSVIAARPSTIPYLSALLPSELELQTLEETDSSEQDDQTDSENTAGNIITVSLCCGNLPSVW